MEKSKLPKFPDSRLECQATVGRESDLCVSALFCFFRQDMEGEATSFQGKQNLMFEDLN